MAAPSTDIYYHEVSPRRMRRAPLALTALAGASMLVAAIAAVSGAQAPLDRETLSDVQFVAYNAHDLDDALGRACAVTGCDAVDLSDLFRAGLPAMDDSELEEAMGLTRTIAARSEEALRALEATGADRPDRAAKLRAQAEADAAVARYHASEAARRQRDTSG